MLTKPRRASSIHKVADHSVLTSASDFFFGRVPTHTGSEDSHTNVLCRFRCEGGCCVKNSPILAKKTRASGSGKSTLIWLLKKRIKEVRKTANVTGRLPRLRKDCIASLSGEFDNSRPLIEQVGSDTKSAIRILNGVGLTEAHLYVKRPSQISEGQRYRFAAALLSDSGKPVWIADEFAATLDPVTAALVAKGVRKLAWLSGATVILAAPHVEHFLESLIPSKVVQLGWGGKAEVSGLQLLCKNGKDRIKLRAKNTGGVVLHEVRFTAVDKNGKRHLLGQVEELRIGKRSRVVDIDPSELAEFSALCVASGKGVGDIVYLGSCPEAQAG